MMYYVIFSYLFAAGVFVADKRTKKSDKVIMFLAAPVSFPVMLGYVLDKFCQWVDSK